MQRRNEPSTVFGRRLKQARLHAGLSQKEVGVKADLDQFVASTRINRYEIGVHTPDFSTAKRLAKVLNVPVAFFYADTERMARLIRAFDKLTAAEQEIFIRDLENR
jgi:transcriptional regulator with XRE-family HTH domain